MNFGWYDIFLQLLLFSLGSLPGGMPSQYLCLNYSSYLLLRWCLSLDILLPSPLFIITYDLGSTFNKMALYFDKYWKHKGNLLLFLIYKDLAFLNNCDPQIIPANEFNLHNMRQIKICLTIL